MEFLWDYHSGSNSRKSQKVWIEYDQDKRRGEVFGDAEHSGEIAIVVGDEVYQFPREDHSDVRVCDRRYALFSAGDMILDPRAIGLSDCVSGNNTPHDCLQFSSTETLIVEGKESIHGVDAWKIISRNNLGTQSLWIEEPAFRIHKRTFSYGALEIEIESTYESSPMGCAIPSRVVSRRSATGNNPAEEQALTVTKLVLDKPIAPDRFTVKTMDIPIGTAVIDYRIKRGLGYWNGSELTDDPYGRKAEPIAPAGRSTWFYLNLGLLIILVCWVAVRSRRAQV